MKTYRMKNKKGGLFGLTRTSKYKDIKLSNEELQKKLQAYETTINEKDEIIKELNDELKQLNWRFTMSNSQYKSLKASNPSEEDIRIRNNTNNTNNTNNDSETIERIDDKCESGNCSVMGGKKKKSMKHKMKSMKHTKSKNMRY
jgi:predicted nuclease with TOPRIM domain